MIPYNWHWFWHWGTGEALNNGTHEVDVCRWALGVDFATRVTSNGGRYRFKDDWETPDTQVIAWDFGGEKSISWEGRSCNGFPSEGLSRGVVVYGTDGTALLEGDNYTVFDTKNRKVKATAEKAEGDPTNTQSAQRNPARPAPRQEFRRRHRFGRRRSTRRSRRATRASRCSTWGTSPSAWAGPSCATRPTGTSRTTTGR